MNINYRNDNFPNLIINGVHKAGTTSLYKYLAEHPQVYASLKKELHYFTPLIHGGQLGSFDQYIDNFKNGAEAKIRLEASPSYFYGTQNIIENIEKTIGDVKFILLLRDPTERFVSFYKQMVKSMQIDKAESFDVFLNKSIFEYQNPNSEKSMAYTRPIREGMYLDYIGDWLSLGKDSQKIIFFDELKKDPSQVMADLCRWLDIDTEFYRNYKFSIENKSLQPKNMFLHNIAYNVYMNNEVFFRKNQSLKKFLKRIYDMVNHKPFSNKSDQNMINVLRKIYNLPNKQLGNLLKQYGYDNTPSWMS